MTLSGMYLNVSSLIFYRSIYSPYDPFLATSLAQVQANGLSAAMQAAAAGNPAGLDPRLQVRIIERFTYLQIKKSCQGTTKYPLKSTSIKKKTSHFTVKLKKLCTIRLFME